MGLFDSPASYLQALRKMGFVEGTSTLILFGIAMPLKYAADMPLAVTIVGSVHGVLFVALVAMLVGAVRRVPMAMDLAALGMLAAIVPFGPFFYDRKLLELERSAASKDSVSHRDASNPA